MIRNLFICHTPSYINNIIEHSSFEFDTIEELLENEHVSKFKKPFGNGKEFYRFSIDEKHLIAEYDNNNFWWVVGYIVYPERLNLPKWEVKKEFYS